MPMLGIMASAISGNLWAPTGAYDSISTATVTTGGTASITFSSIPQTYTHLQIRGFLQADRTNYPIENANMTFNADSASNYSAHFLYGGINANVQTTASGSSLSSSLLLINIAGDTNGGQFGASVIDILDYSNTNKYKTIKYIGGNDINTTNNTYSGQIAFGSGNWRNSASGITSITITPQSSSNWNIYSSFALYGIK